MPLDIFDGNINTPGSNPNAQPWWTNPSWWNVIGDFAGSAGQYVSQERANNKNVQLSREQRAWEKEMSDTAIQRRAKDFEAAGFNRVLAATGIGASTPSVSAPTVESAFSADSTKGSIGTAALLAAQIGKLRADTEVSHEQGRSAKVQADIDEMFASKNAGTDREIKIQNLEIAVQKALQEFDQTKMTASQRAVMEDSQSALIIALKNKAEAGSLSLSAMKQMEEQIGLNMPKLVPFFKLLISLLGGYKP